MEEHEARNKKKEGKLSSPSIHGLSAHRDFFVPNRDSEEELEATGVSGR